MFDPQKPHSSANRGVYLDYTNTLFLFLPFFSFSSKFEGGSKRNFSLIYLFTW